VKEYFSHDYNTRLDKKIKRLISKHGMLGYGIFWSIIEDLYNNANALQLDYDSIAYDLRIEENLAKSVILDFELFIIDGDFFGSESVERRLSERNKKSTKARESAFKRWNKSEDNANALQTQSDSNAIKEKNIIVKDIKENNIKEEKIQESPFGDGRLHFICKDYSNKNPDKYQKEFYIEFLQYWTAPIQKGPKKGVELWRDEKTFQIASRLSTSWNTIWKNRPQEKQIQQTPKIVASTQHYEKPLEPTEEEKIAFRKENGLID